MHMFRAYRRVGKGKAIYLEAKKATGRLTKYDLQENALVQYLLGRFVMRAIQKAHPNRADPCFKQLVTQPLSLDVHHPGRS